YPSAAALVSRTEVPGPTSLAALRALLAGVRRDGVATEHGEVTAGYASVAALVLDHAGQPAAAVAVTYADRSQPDLPGLVDAVRRTAGELTRRLAPGR
ncbi:MAG TPA: IclR family transcriptional regulator C-terminal domain-containing protein, partial [Candidatus Nanopelagicales bacterium]|nr:IclR family transcriptional regulator C-terminal domain-containing protein [Candidatus Nanopelagicales bacterium]